MKKLLYNIYWKNPDFGLIATLTTCFTIIGGIVKLVSLFSITNAIDTGVALGIVTPFLVWIVIIIIANQDMPDDTKTIQRLCRNYDVAPDQIILLGDNAVITLDDGTKVHVEATPPHIYTKKEKMLNK